MEITIQSVNFETSAALNDFITKKLKKLEHFADNIRNAEVALRIVNAGDKVNKEISVKLFMGDTEFFSCKQAEVYEDAVAQAADALERQLTKYKEKKQA